MKKIRIALFVLGVLVVLPTAAQTNLEDIQEKGVIRLGVANEAPYGYQAPDGRMTGEAPEIARKILEKIDPDIQVEGVVVPFNDLISDLNAGRFDVIAAGMFITPARCRQIAFTDPTYKIGEALAVKAGNPKNLTDFDSIAKQPDARLAVMAGAVEYGYAYEAGVFVDQVSVYPSYQEALEALQGGRIDAIAMTSLSVRDLVGQNPDAGIEATPQFFPVLDGEPVAGYGAFGFRNEDQALRAAFNQHLADFIGTDAHWETVRPFGFVPDMAPNKRAAELCQE